MKILHVITSLRTGGAEKLMVDLLPRLRDMGQEVDLCVFDGVHTAFYELLEQQGIKIFVLQVGGSVYDVRNIFALMHLIKGYDIVHTHNTACQLFTAIAHVFAPDARLVTTEHNTTNRRRGRWYLKWGDLWMYRQYERIICISDQASNNLAQYIGASSKILTIYNGINLDRFISAPGTSAERDEKVVTMVSAFRAQKDQKTLIKAFDLLPDNYVLQLVGDGELRSETEIFGKQFGCFDRIKFLGNRDDVPELLKNSDVIILSSHYEGLSLSSLEGMASGRPFIASDVDGLHEIVDGYGVLFPHGDDKALAKCILELTTDADYCAAVVKRCKERALQYDISRMVEGYNRVYLNK